MLLEAIEQIDFYSGTRNSSDTVSVSEVVDNEPLLGYLKRKFEPKPSKVSQATLGNIFDIGMKQIILDYKIGNFEIGKRLEYTTLNGSKLTGEPDIIDPVNKVIYDVKLTKVHKHTIILQDPTADAYGIQVNLYNLMLGWGDKSRLYLFMGLKDQTEARQNQPNAIEEVEIPHIKEDKLIEMIDTYYEKVFSIIDGKGAVPSKCENTFGNDMRCKYYCDYNHICKYGKKYCAVGSSWF